jgi:hypothetical protein
MPNPGSIASRVPYGTDAAVRKRQDLQRQQKEQAAARRLESSSIGRGGLRVKDGGSIVVEAGGDITLEDGDFAAGTVTAGTTMHAGQDATAARDVAATRNVTAGSVVSAPAVVGTSSVTGANVYAQSIATNITAGRVAVWGRTSDGFLGTASSSQRFKTALQAVDLDDRAKRILQIAVGYFEYLAEIARRDDPTSPDYVGPDYHVSVNLGAIAEQLHELGLWEWVVYEREPVTQTMTDEDGVAHDVVVGEKLKLDDTGEPIPFAIHDILIGWAALIVDQYQEKRLAALEGWATAQGFTGAAA